jgi:predicted nucleic acid-binding protein
MVNPAGELQVTPDPDDNIFLECADTARADYLVTGNAAFSTVLEENEGNHVPRVH